MGRTLPLSRGTFTVSIDLELLWGVWDLAPTSNDECAEREREITTRLLALFHTYDVRVTWAVVGRLLDDTRGFDGLRASPRCWFSPDIVEAIQRDPIDHEIGSHSYGHIYFRASTREQVAEDLDRARTVHQKHGVPFTSFVFPRNQLGHLDLLRESGLRVFRSTDAGVLRWADARAASLRPVINLADKALAIAPPLVEPILHESGLIELPSSMLLMARNGMRRVIHPRALERKLREGLRAAAKERKLFHLWFHPSNFYAETDTQFSVLEHGLHELATLRARGDIDVLTMGDFAAPARHASASA